MGNANKIDDIGELGRLESSCKAFEEGLKSASDGFAGATAELGGAWKDNQYHVLVSRVEPILAECANALAVVSGTLTPFIEQKRRWAESRPGN